jgi:hypothetical protein
MRLRHFCAVILAATTGLFAPGEDRQSTGPLSLRAIGNANDESQIDREPATRLRTLVEQVVGHEPHDCGQLHRTRQSPLSNRVDSETIDPKAMERALGCARESASKRRPFFTYVSEYGIDSWLASGLMGTKRGQIIRFSFDSLGGGRLEQDACARPRVDRSRSGWLSFVCD